MSIKIHVFKKLYYALILVKRGGLPMLLRELVSRIYRKTSYIWLVMELDSKKDSHSSKIKYELQAATHENFRKIYDSLKVENGRSLFELLRRISFYERGFDSCYIALTDSGEVCYMQWLLSARHNALIKAGYPLGMRKLEESEAMLENAFTFPRYRKKGIMTSVMIDLAEIARSQGFSRMLTQVDKDNKASLNGCYRAGFHNFDEEQEVRLLFRIWRRKGISPKKQQVILETK